MTDKQCERCGEVNPAEIHTCTPKQEPVAWSNVLPGGRITDAMESARVGDYNQGWNDYRKAAKATLEKAYAATHRAFINVDDLIADLEKLEPVAWMYEWDGRKHLTFTDQRFVEKAHPHFNKSTPLYTAPPQREWQGLTDEDLSVCDENGVILARYWEAKLKEKNA